MENRSMEDDKEEINQLVAVLEEQQKKEKDCLDNLDKLARELTDREQRRESTARRRDEALQMHIMELVQLQAVLVTSGTPMARGTATEQAIKSAKDALAVEEAHRDELDEIEFLFSYQQRRARTIEVRCVAYARKILSYRKVEAAEHGKLTPAVRDRSDGSAAAAWSSNGAVRERLFSPIRIDSPTRPGDKGLLRPALASFSLGGPVFLTTTCISPPASSVGCTRHTNDTVLRWPWRARMRRRERYLKPCFLLVSGAAFLLWS